ncbi:MAG: hydroxymethylglutaryl-CoA reductase [Deltaproteobacteria bacterium]|nr:MAG: hydroxymethylglutaryl-CoA reductase [Deltaproteobacteria bacterium]
MRDEAVTRYATIPMKRVGPIRIRGPWVDDTVLVPLATFESPLWPSVNRGAKVSRKCGGIHVELLDDRMTRSVVLEAPGVAEAVATRHFLESHREELQEVAASSSRFTTLIGFHTQIVGNLLYLRFEAQTGDAAGHNMITAAADRLVAWLLEKRPRLRYVSVSGNFCVDKKVSAVNGLLGRGKNVVAEIEIPREICRTDLKTTPEEIVRLNIAKNLIGSTIAGGIRTANAHFANILLAFYLATGQDAGNIVEGSQGFVHTEVREGALYFSVTVPNIIVGTVGSGKTFDFVQENLEMMGCLSGTPPGTNARRLAVILGATVLCGELSLLSAQTNPGELMRVHLAMERTPQ